MLESRQQGPNRLNIRQTGFTRVISRILHLFFAGNLLLFVMGIFQERCIIFAKRCTSYPKDATFSLWIMIFWHSSTIFCPVTSTIIIDQVTTISLLYSCLGGDVWISSLPLLVCSNEFLHCYLSLVNFSFACLLFYFFLDISVIIVRVLAFISSNEFLKSLLGV